MIPQPIIDIAEICVRKQIKNVVVSPGSRSAPLLLSFVRHPDIKPWVFPDERSAGYVACGIAAFTKMPTAIICTSGTAALNLGPAVAEAFYQQLPLIVFTADRPPEWIDQYDNQTIRQTNLYGQHVKKSYSLPVTFDHPDDIWHLHRIISEAINNSISGKKGPVHINVPLREPLYPARGQQLKPTNIIQIIEAVKPPTEMSAKAIEEFRHEWEKYDRKLAVSGQGGLSTELLGHLAELHNNGLPIVADITSNFHQSDFGIRRHDIFLNEQNNRIKTLKPDLLITWGKTVLSKNLKTFLRKNKPTAHWHIQNDVVAADTYQSVTKVIQMEPNDFFRQIKIMGFKGNPQYLKFWQQEEDSADSMYDNFISQAEFGEFKAVDMVLKYLPNDCHLHLASSMPVRYANFVGLKGRNIEIFSNRGVSGIDGCGSFAVGTMLVSGKMTVLITGDLAFFYDRNAYWHNYPIDKLRIVLLNNHGGVIFRIIDGPNAQPELEEFFETKQRLNALNTAKDFEFGYSIVKNEQELAHHIQNFFDDDGKPKIMEIETMGIDSKKIFDQFKNLIKEEYEA